MKHCYSIYILVIVIATAIFICCQDGSGEVTKKKVQNLEAFARLYGYVRFFHPSDEGSKIDWDKFAIYGAARVAKVKNSDELKSILQELFLPLGPTVQIYRSGEKPDDFLQELSGVLPEDKSDLKVVAWQHKGVGLGASNQIYSSIRINRENEIAAPGYGFGTVTQNIEAVEYRGKEIKLSASVRADVEGAGNQGQLWLRVDRENKKMGFFNNMDDRPIKSQEWKHYEIEGRVDDDAKNIAFGCFLHGKGKVWVDEFQIEVKSEGEEWQPVELKNPGFEEIDAEDMPEMWSAASPGYAYKVVDENPYKGKKSLLIKNEKTIFTGTLFEKHPQVGEVINKKLNADLYCQVPLALYSDEKGTLGNNENYPLDELLSRLGKISLEKASANDERVRLADVIILWNIFQHFYPYFDVIDIDWQAELTNTLDDALRNKNEKEFFVTLRRFTEKIQDGHAGVYHEMMSEKAGLPILVNWIEDRLVVTVSEDEENFEVGDIILEIDGKPAEKVLAEQEQYISGAPQWKRYQALHQVTKGREGSTAKVKIKRGERVLDLEMERRFKDFLSEPRKEDIAELEDDIYYVNLAKASMDQLNEHINKLAEAKGIVFDMRGYPKGNHDIISHLTDEPVQSAIWNVPQIIYPDQENIVGWDTSGRWTLEPKKPRIKGKVVFLTDGRAISYTESFMGIIEHYKLGEIVGQATAGTNGNVNPVGLPGGFRVMWTGMKVIKHDGSQHHLIGILPTVPVERTVKALVEGRDEYIEKALEIIKN